MVQFRKDLTFGKQYEMLLIDLVEHTHFEMAPSGAYKPWDIRFYDGDASMKVEVKADRMTGKTGNLAIEFECSGKPSGIATTDADVWAYFAPHASGCKWWWIPVADIRAAIDGEQYSSIKSGGDGWRARMYLFPESVFAEHCNEL